MRIQILKVSTIVLWLAAPAVALAQAAQGGGQAISGSTRQAAIEQEQAQKATALHPYVPNKGERLFERLDGIIEGRTLKWHPFLQNAYSGGGFALGIGRAIFVGPDNYFDVRGSYSIANYKRAEVEFVAPKMFHRRAELSVLGGWREATQVGFYGLGTNTSVDDRTDYLFQQPHGSALFTIYPARKVLKLRGGVEFTRWLQKPGEGTFPSVETRYTPATLPGLGAEVTYLHTQGTVALDGRIASGYARRYGYVGATLHNFQDRDDRFGFQLTEYEGIAHLPILRETWVLSFRGRVQNATPKNGEQVPFFLMPSLGGGSTLRGFSSWRFRDLNSLLLQAEWRIMINRYLDLAFFYDTGKVTARKSDLDFDGLENDYGIGLRFHGPFATPLRIEVARSNERSFALVFASSAAF
jgi:hypothetical protein